MISKGKIYLTTDYRMVTILDARTKGNRKEFAAEVTLPTFDTIKIKYNSKGRTIDRKYAEHDLRVYI